MAKSIAVIGAGNWGRNLVRTLSEIGVLTHVVDAVPETRERVSEEYPDIRVIAEYDELLADDTIDAVVIATPVPTHHAIGMAFLKAGKDVFIEKPMTLTEADAEALVATAESAGRILMIGHLLMYQPAIGKIKELIDAKVIGDVYTIHQVRRKLGRARSVENVLWSFGVHDVAVLLYLVGESPKMVSASGHRGINQGVEDDVYLHLDFESGIKAHLHNSWLWPEDRRCLTVVGSEGMITFDEHARQVVVHRKRIDSATLQNHDDGEEVVFEGAPRPLEIEMRHFLSCLETREEPISSGRSGLEVTRVLVQAEL